MSAPESVPGGQSSKTSHGVLNSSLVIGPGGCEFLPFSCPSSKWERCISATGILAAAAYNPIGHRLCLDEVPYVEYRRRHVHHDQRPYCYCCGWHRWFVGVSVMTCCWRSQHRSSGLRSEAREKAGLD